jgi:hypothetical protein
VTFARAIALLSVTAVVSLFVSRELLMGPDPEGWWNFVPGILFYLCTWVALGLTVVWAVDVALVRPFRRCRASR